MEPWFSRFWHTRCKQSVMNQLPTFVMENSTKKDFRKMAFNFHGSTADPNQLHISVQMNTDGVSLFHLSSFSI